MNNPHQPETIKIVVEEVSDGFRIFHTNFELTTLEGSRFRATKCPRTENSRPSPPRSFRSGASKPSSSAHTESASTRPWRSSGTRSAPPRRKFCCGSARRSGGPEAEAKQTETPGGPDRGVTDVVGEQKPERVSDARQSCLHP